MIFACLTCPAIMICVILSRLQISINLLNSPSDTQYIAQAAALDILRCFFLIAMAIAFIALLARPFSSAIMGSVRYRR